MGSPAPARRPRRLPAVAGGVGLSSRRDPRERCRPPLDPRSRRPPRWRSRASASQAAGTHETALSPERIDLGGRCVVPGFTDSHVHFPTWSLAQRQVRLEGAGSLDEALARVASAVSDVPSGRWLRGLGWRSGEWSPAGEPTKEALDLDNGPGARRAHVEGLPLAVAQLGGARARRRQASCPRRRRRAQRAGRAHRRPSGGVRLAFWTPTSGRRRTRWVSPRNPGLALPRGRLGPRQGRLARGPEGLPASARGRRAQPARLAVASWDQLESLESIGLASGLGDDLLRVGISRRSWTGRSARAPRSCSTEAASRSSATKSSSRSCDGAPGRPVAVHAIGDLGNRRALDAYEETQEEWRPRGLRPRIEHAQLLAPEDVGRFAELGVAASVQFSHAPSDRDLADEFWAGKTDGAYAFRSLVDSGVVVANGSDAPVEELDPLLGIRAGVLRSLDDREAWQPEQAVTVEQALHATCVAPAWLTGDERRRGKLLPGYLADLVVLDRDPLDCPVEELGEIEVVATMVGGRWVHNSPPWD